MENQAPVERRCSNRGVAEIAHPPGPKAVLVALTLSFRSSMTLDDLRLRSAS
jgi:hypothetical protein